MKCQFVLVALLLLSCSACSQSLYQWGSYETSVYRMYGGDDEFSIDQEIELLSSEVDRVIERNGQVPPGKMAHLGYLCYLRGRTDEARRYFVAEKKLYPESAVLLDRLLARMQ